MNLQVSIIAPRWEVIAPSQQQRLISLEGKAGDSILIVKNETEQRGEDGKPGKPEGNGGIMIGIYDEILNRQLLKISVNGGTGGAGQPGGNGNAGENGSDASEDDFPSAYSLSTNISGEFVSNDLVLTIIYNHRWLKKLGKPGRTGGDGGDGGVGGYPGLIEIYTVGQKQNRNEIQKSARTGKNGINGEGGKGGTGGNNGNSYHCKWRSVTLVVWWDSCAQEFNGERAGNGSNGVAGSNFLGQILPTPPPTVGKEWKVVADYKYFILEFGSETRLNFLQKIETHPNLTKLYDNPFSFAQELFNLEKVFYKLGTNTTLLLDEYQLLLQRIETFKQLQNSDITRSHKKVLNFLSALLQSKISFLHGKNKFSHVIVDFPSYLNSIAEDIEKLRKGETLLFISQEEQRLLELIEQEQPEVISFLASTTFPFIDQLDSKITKVTNELIQEITACILKPLESDYRLEINRPKFELALLGPNLLQGISVVGSILVLLLNLDSPGHSDNPTIRNYIFRDSIENQSHFKFNSLNNTVSIQVALISKLLNKYPSSFLNSSIQSKLENLEKSFEYIKEFEVKGNGSQLEIYGARESFEIAQWELNTACEKTLEELRGRKDRESLRAATNLVNVLPVLTLAVGNSALYTAVKPAAQKQRQRIAQLIKGLTQTYKNIQRRKLSLIKSFLDVLNFQQITSSVALTHIIEKLKESLTQLNEFTKGLEQDELIVLCIKNLENVFTMMVGLFEQKLNYSMKRELAKSIDDGNLHTFSIVDDDDSRAIGPLLTKTEFLMKANLLQLRYEEAQSVFKQVVFPFAKNFTGHEHQQISEAFANMLEGKTGPENDIAIVAQAYLNQIEKLRRAANAYKTFTNDENSYFTSDFNSTFYVWRYEEWENSIRQLLSGKVVNFHADICNSANKSAVKLKSIEVYFKHKNISAQNELESSLRAYQTVMTHSGVSYYRVLSDMIRLRSSKQTFLSSFALSNTSINGSCCNNTILDETERSLGDQFVLSPYTTWGFQLTNTLANISAFVNFHNLERFAGLVDLELRGEGMYINELAVSSKYLQDLNVNTYYQMDLKCSQSTER